MAVDPLSIIEQKESGGRNVPNYKYGPGFSASGHYQIIDETWRRWAKAAGIDISQYPTAMSAPKEVQRAVAAQGYQQEGFRPWEATKSLVGQEGNYGAAGSGVLSASGTQPSPYNRIGDLSPYVAKGKTIEGSNAQLLERLQYALGAMPEDVRKSFLINSGFRTPQEQQVLWDRSDKSGHMVARPGHSQHGMGNAFDIGGGAARDWLHQHGAEYGLKFPMSYEPWHIETAETRGGQAFNAPWAGGTNVAGAAPGVISADGTAPAPVDDGGAAAGFDEAIKFAQANQAQQDAQAAQEAAQQQQQAAQAQQAQAQQQATQAAPQPGQPGFAGGPGAPGDQGNAATMMAGLLDRKKQQRAGPVPGVLNAWSV